MSYLKRGKIGYHGSYIVGSTNNKIVHEINELVEEYNQKINSFDTELENDEFHNLIHEKIKKCKQLLQ